MQAAGADVFHDVIHERELGLLAVFVLNELAWSSPRLSNVASPAR
jgi:hypothetical protein